MTYTFLEINGASLTADADAIYSFIDRLYRTNNFAFAHLYAWLKEKHRIERQEALSRLRA